MFRRLASVSVFLQASWGYNPNGLIVQYCQLFHKYETHHGMLYAAQKMKLLFSVAQRYACGQDFEAIPFMKIISKSTKLPYVLKPFRHMLEGTIDERRTALTVLSLYRLIPTRNEVVDYSQIEAPRIINRDLNDLSVDSDNSYLARRMRQDPSGTNARLLACWRHCVKTMFPPSGLEHRTTMLHGDNIYLSNKNGPNGPALGGIALDFEAVRIFGLLDEVQGIASLTNNEQLKYIIDVFSRCDLSLTKVGDPVAPSKLSLKQEPGGKNRIFAIGDWFTQSALMSMHRYLFGLLSRLSEDGTHSHNYVAQICKRWSADERNEIFSIDLTGATNFIDCEVLGELVASMFGEQYARHWINLMIRRPFLDIEGNTKMYTVGQPMGFYSSWAMLAIWNHLMVRTARRFNQLRPSQDEPQFVIIGDDVAILGRDVASTYERLCSLMGVPLSPLKGFSPKTKSIVENPIKAYCANNSVEIAKRVFVNGFELSPISPVEISAGLETVYHFPALLLSGAERGIDTSNENFVFDCASRSPDPDTSIDVALFPMAPCLNWLTVQGNMVIIDRYPESFWNGLPLPVISNLFNNYLILRLRRAIELFNKTILSYRNAMPDTLFTCREYEFLSFGYAATMQIIARVATDRSNAIQSRFQVTGVEEPLPDEDLSVLVAKSRNTRRTIGLVTSIFEIESLLSKEPQKFEDRNDQIDRIITAVVKDIRCVAEHIRRPTTKRARRRELSLTD